MPPVTNPKTHALLKDVFSRWNKPRAINWIQRALDGLFRICPGASKELVNKAMAEHFLCNSVVNQVAEKQPSLIEMGKDNFFEFRLTVEGTKVYIKGRLMDGPEFYVMGFKEGWLGHGQAHTDDDA